ncbi:MAG TPA: pitrilysin family protein [Vicinamibacterales bacterium]|jgi:predicted Zn-dependent peptidase|nr:pitrilysin family protein [Vicinamibacterales bacterium]
MTPTRFFVALTLAATAAVGAQTQAPDRSKPPALGPAVPVKLPSIQKSKLSNGLPVWIVEMHKVPVVQVNLLVLTGSVDEVPGKYGIGSLTAAMLEEGAGTRSALDIADAIDFLGADLNSGVGIDSTGIRLHTTVAKLADALPIMADVALRPTFPPSELERLRQQRLTSLAQARDSPETVSSLAFARVLFGQAHRFGTATLGTSDTIKSFTPTELRAYYHAVYRPEHSVMLVVGDVTPAKVLPLLETNFGKWRAAAVAASTHVALPAPPARASRGVYIVDKPGAAQSQIRIGMVGVPRSTPDYFPVQVMNMVLGGSFDSRLNMNLREKHGYTYGAQSQFDMRVSAGPFTATAGVQTDKTAEALKEFFNELNAILEPVSADELTRAKNNITLRFPERFETTTDVSDRLEQLLVYQLPDDYFSSYVRKTQAVTAADAQRVAKAHLSPAQMAVVVVGDQKVIEPAIEGLNLGPITHLTLDEIFGPR